MSERVKLQNCQQVRQGAKYCLYWLRDCLRVKSNFSLNHAIQQANAAKLPLVAVYLYDPGSNCTSLPERAGVMSNQTLGVDV
jgi:deoxyribodipyrimidine photolyase